MNIVTVVHGTKRSSYAIDDLPLAISTEAPDSVLPAVASTSNAALIGHEDGDFFLQAGSLGSILVNGLALETSRWIADGDELTLNETGVLFRLTDGVLSVLVESKKPASASAQPGIPTHQQIGDVEISAIPFQPRWHTPPPQRGFRLSPRLIAVFAAFVLLAIGVWFVMTARAVRIETLPSTETVALEGGLTLKIGGRYLLRPGAYTVLAECPGYLDLRSPLLVGKQTPPVVQYELQPLGGTLSIRSQPVSGAAVFIDGVEVGTTPLDDHQLSAGIHHIKLHAAMHLPYDTELEIEPGAEPILLEINLEPNWAALIVASKPPGATVFVDGQSAGETPIRIEIEAGAHGIELLLNGFKGISRRILVMPGKAVDLGTLELEALDGKLALTSDPDGATVLIDQQFRGTTPLEIALKPDTAYDLKVSLAGFATYSKSFSVASGKKTNIHATLETMTSEVVISSEPPRAEIFIDGKIRGTTEQRLQLATRPHELVIQLKGFEPFRTELTPHAGITQAVHAVLVPEGPAGQPPTLTSPQGVEMVKIGPGQMTMGASRREPGRRANEVLRKVEISSTFYLAIREVSNQEFREFKSSHLSGGYGGQNLEIDHHPVVNVTWQDAARYCNWLSQKAGLTPVYIEQRGVLVPRLPLPDGFRLPTEAEWAFAARTASTSGEQKYGWGNSMPIPLDSGNYGDLSAAGILEGSLPNYKDGYAATAPVGSFRPNAYGVFNLGGNVSEWVQDFYGFTPSAPGIVEKDPTGPATGDYHVIRGASWMDTAVTELRLSYRDYADTARPDVGFRIARNAS